MASKDNVEYRSVSGKGETSEPANSPAGIAASRKAPSAPRSQTPSHSTSTLPHAPTLRQTSSSNLVPQVSSPLAQSPRSSRNTSPVRKDRPQSNPGQPSAAAIQRALSASNVSQGGSVVSDAISRLPARANRTGNMSGDNTPQWPVSPRLKSPPPSGPNSRRGSNAAQRRPESNAAPSIHVLSATPSNTSPAPPSNRQANSDAQKPEPQLQPPPPPKNSSRGPSGKSMLETVQENGNDTQEPSPAAVQAAADLKPLTKLNAEDKLPSRDIKAEDQKPSESGSESAGNKSDSAANPRGRRPSASNSSSQSQPPRTRTTSSKNYAVSSARSKPGDSKGGMTVETETVQSIPQSGLAPASEQANRLRADNGGTVKLKPSNETIRPKKERKKADRKTRSVNQGTATSKADLFEARVANAVDEANTSDSDETFVYESNPPEPQRRQRHHSRTPSVTSAHSIVDQQRGIFRSLNDPFDDRRIGGKRSMKFSSNPYQDVDSPENKDGTVRTHTPRHIGRHGRGGHHSASYDHGDSPFTQASKIRHSHIQRSRPTSPRSPQSMQFRSGGFFSGNRKQEHPYDFDTEQIADDERTPLVGTVRTHRGVRGVRRMNSHLAYPSDPYSSSEGRWRFGRIGSCLLTTLVVVLVLISAGIFIFASNRGLIHVEIHKIQNVLATEEELIMDLMVGAVNPNAWDITISDMDLNLFAKSKYVNAHDSDISTSAPSNRRLADRARRSFPDRNPNPSQDLSGHWHAPADGTEVEKDATTMYIGHVSHFDQGISFEASPIKQHRHYSAGQVRLMKPGNKTETGGSARWEKIIQNPFDLVVRGVLKYNLPISSRPQSVAVGGSMTVHPEDGIDDKGNMRVVPVDKSDHWQWIDWPDFADEEGLNRKKVMEEVDQPLPA